MAVMYRTDPDYFERLDGREYPKVSPLARHGIVQATISHMLRSLVGSSGRVMNEVRFRIGAVDGTDSWLLPDVAVVMKGMDRIRPLRLRNGEPLFAPDIAVEVRSPGQRKSLRERKIVRYLVTGTLLVLDADPATHTIIAHSERGIRAYAEGDVIRDPQFPWLALDVTEAFNDLKDVYDEDWQ